ncbi:hypothetical protein [Teredinibacter haidensis]|uniref:hypothetical protein n=1 Tax=Teredinibacter haidensis TaxID=2731755 RepID=UPI000948ADD1|nr:hypothetical protein [Teredinibacter haidensis]
MKSKGFFLALIAISAIGASSNTLSCQEQAKTALEEVLCKLKTRGKGAQLPPLNEFRKNSENIQRLLLKTPARKAGLSLPPAAPKKSATAPIKPVNKPSQRIKQEQSTSLDNCKLQKQWIICRTNHYQLQTNRQNQELNTTVFSQSNSLNLASRDHPRFSGQSDLHYLSLTYPLYLDKMLSIGLGDSTMSFTRYAATYREIIQQGESFELRFGMMFEHLKNEKANNSIKRRYDSTLPSTIQQCMRANADLIVCDNVKRNWLYRREP